MFHWLYKERVYLLLQESFMLLHSHVLYSMHGCHKETIILFLISYFNERLYNFFLVSHDFYFDTKS